VSPADLVSAKPTRVLVLAWNLRNEVAAELRALGLSNCELYTAIPQLEMYERL
jgi:hypothetical protein